MRNPLRIVKEWASSVTELCSSVTELCSSIWDWPLAVLCKARHAEEPAWQIIQASRGGTMWKVRCRRCGRLWLESSKLGEVGWCRPWRKSYESFFWGQRVWK